MEIPHLKELRETMTEDDLAILAVSFKSPRETEQKIKAFAKHYKINYDVFSVDFSHACMTYFQSGFFNSFYAVGAL